MTSYPDPGRFLLDSNMHFGYFDPKIAIEVALI